MGTWREDMVESWRSLLREVRQSAPEFESIRYSPTVDADGLAEDANRLTRAQCLWALQYEPRTPTDPLPPPLLTELLRAEVEWHRAAPFQGFTDELKLAAYLVAREPSPTGLALMWPAKTANFDTWCGLDSRFLAAGGVDAAISRAVDLGPAESDLLENLVVRGAPAYTDADIAEFLSELAEYFPQDPADEPAQAWIERARELSEDEVARQALEAWVHSDAPSDESLQYAWASIECWDEAVGAQTRVLAAAGGARTDPLQAVRLAELHRRAGDLDLALATLDLARPGLNRRTDPYGNLRRSLVEEGFLIARQSAGDVAQRAFTFADTLAQDKPAGPVARIFGRKPAGEWLPLVVLQAGAEAAAAAGEPEREAHYRERAAREQARIDAASATDHD